MTEIAHFTVIFSLQSATMATNQRQNAAEFKLILVGDGGVGMFDMKCIDICRNLIISRQNNVRQATFNRRIRKTL